MIQWLHPSQRPILVATSETSDAALARSAIEELGLIPVLVQEARETIRHLSGGPNRYAALVAGERVGQATGFTLCGVARDAGCRLPMLLLTSDVCRWTAVRAARLQVSVLWEPVPRLSARADVVRDASAKTVRGTPLGQSFPAGPTSTPRPLSPSAWRAHPPARSVGPIAGVTHGAPGSATGEIRLSSG
jgi:hypothetical protein